MARRENIDERMQCILDQVLRDGTLSVEQIAAQLGTSIATVRRDLQRLQEEGRLKRTHGGAVAVQPLLYEPFRHDSSFQEQMSRHADEKRRIAAAAAKLIEDGDVLGVTPGTTTTQLTRSVPERKGITVVTNTVNIPMELSSRPDIEVLVLGGFLRGEWFSLVGTGGADTSQQLVIDKMFIGVKGIDRRWGLTAGNPGEAALNRAMIGRARKRIVVADHSKLGAAANFEFWPADQIDLLITDSGATKEALRQFYEMSIEVLVV